jgi:hypothetical protein
MDQLKAEIERVRLAIATRAAIAVVAPELAAQVADDRWQRVRETLKTPGLFDAMGHEELWELARPLDEKSEPVEGSPEWINRTAAQLVLEYRERWDERDFRERMARDQPQVELRPLSQADIDREKELTAFFIEIDQETGFATWYQGSQMERRFFHADAVLTPYLREQRKQREEAAPQIAEREPLPGKRPARSWERQEFEERFEKLRRSNQSPPSRDGREQAATTPPRLSDDQMEVVIKHLRK